MTTTKRHKMDAASVPQNRDEADALLAAIGWNERSLETAKARMDDKIEKLRLDHQEKMKPIQAELDRDREALQSYCAAHRSKLTEDGKRKTVQFVSGKVAWRKRPPSVKLNSAAAVLRTLLAIPEAPFIRTKQEVDKDAMLAAREQASEIPGVTIVSEREDFVITPTRTAEETPEAKSEDGVVNG